MQRVQVILDATRAELLRPGFAESIPGFFVNEWTKGTFFDSANTGNVLPMPLGQYFWKEPNMGVIMLRPSFMDTEIGDPTVLPIESGRITDSEVHAVSVEYHGLTGTWKILNKWNGGGSPYSEIIETLNEAAILAINATASSRSLSGIWQTKNALQANEGFSVFYHPSGVMAVQPKSMLAVDFGGSFFLDLRSNGIMELLHNRGTQDAPDFQVVWKQTYRAQDPGGKTPIAVTVIPWGYSYLSIFVSQGAVGTLGLAPKTGFGDPNGFQTLIDLEKLGISCPNDEVLGNNIKTQPAKLTLYVPTKESVGSFVVYRARYPVSVSFRAFPIELDQVYDQGLVPTTYGYASAYSGYPKISSKLLGLKPDNTTEAYDPEVHTKVTAEVTLTSDISRIHTPELWWMSYEAKPVTFVPDHATNDVSTRWSYVRFSRRRGTDNGRAEIKLEGSQAANMFQRGSPIDISVRSNLDDTWIKVFEGYGRDLEFSLEGASADEARGFDLLPTEEIAVGDYVTERFGRRPFNCNLIWTGKSVAWLLRKCFEHGGCPDSEIEIDPIFESMDLQDFVAVKSMEGAEKTTMIGDVLRRIGEQFNLQGHSGLFIHRRNGKCYATLSAISAASDPVPIVFYAHESALETAGYSTDLSDLDRWTHDPMLMKVTGQVNASNNLPEFNALWYKAQSTAEKDTAILCQIDPDPRVLDDPSFDEYEGRLRLEISSPSRNAPDSDIGIERKARMRYDLERLKGRRLVVEAEWQPGIWEDMTCLVVGRDELGNDVSYGIYRIETMDVEIRSDVQQDSSKRPHDTRWSMSGRYSLRFEHRSTIVGLPMVDAVPPGGIVSEEPIGGAPG